MVGWHFQCSALPTELPRHSRNAHAILQEGRRCHRISPPRPRRGAASSPPRYDAGCRADAGSDRTQPRPCPGRRPPLPDTTQDIWRMQGATALSTALARGGVLPSPTRRGMSGGCRERSHSAPPLRGAASSLPRHDAGCRADAGSDRTQPRPCPGRRPPLPDTTQDIWRMQGATALSTALARGGVLPSPTRRGMSGGCRERSHSAPPLRGAASSLPRHDAGCRADAGSDRTQPRPPLP